MVSIPKRPLCYARRHSGEQFKPKLPSSPPPEVKDGFLAGIISRISSPSSGSPEEWTPIHNYEQHLKYMKRSGFPQKEIDDLREKHENYYKNNPPRKVEPLPDYSVPVNSISSDVVVNMAGDGKGGVCVKVVENPFKDFYKEGNTVDDYIQMYVTSGCSNELIERVKMRFAKVEKERAGSIEFMDRVMSKYQGKSSSKTKKASLRSRISRKYKINTIKVEDLDDTMDEV